MLQETITKVRKYYPYMYSHHLIPISTYPEEHSYLVMSQYRTQETAATAYSIFTVRRTALGSAGCLR